MPTSDDAPTVLEAQVRLHAWSVANAHEQSRRIREARDAGVEEDHIAKITGFSAEVVRKALEEEQLVSAAYAGARS